MAEVVGFVGWEDFSKFDFDFLRVFGVYQTHAVCQADAMGVHDHTTRNTVDVA